MDTSSSDVDGKDNTETASKREEVTNDLKAADKAVSEVPEELCGPKICPTPEKMEASENGLPDEITSEKLPELNVKFSVIHNKEKYEVMFDVNRTIKQLKDHLQGLINVPQSMQKIMIKGLAKDEQILKDLGVKEGSKVMVVGSRLDQILKVASGPSSQDVSEEKTSIKEPFCKQKLHLKILAKGIPDDVMVGIKNVQDPLPSTPLTGMLNKSGAKVRLSFRLEADQVWISTKERTDKVTMNSIKTVVSEPIEGHEEYNIVGLQLGTTEASRYWLYWVPSQYVNAIKNTILGTWFI